MDFVKSKLLNKRVSLKLLGKDQYQRILGIIRYNDGFNRDVDISEELLRQGLGVVYRQSGAQYDNRLDIFNNLESIAIKERKGIWSKGFKNADLPSNYKANMRAKSSI